MSEGPQTMIRPQDMEVSAEAVGCLAKEMAVRYRVCPLGVARDANGVRTLTLAAVEAGSLPLADELQQATGCRIRLTPATEHNVMLGIALHYTAPVPEPPAEALGALDQPTPQEQAKQAQLRELVERPGASATVDGILKRAIDERATDIHIQPFESTVFVRFRIDGVMYDHLNYDPAVHAQIISRIKIMGNLDIAQNRLPQDGRFDVKADQRAYDVRVSVVPVMAGEKAVLRILPKGQVAMTFGELGCTARNRETIEELLRKPFGMVLATGPTGSGKTTTLYTCLSTINCVERTVVTIEDPVEYYLQRVDQIQVHPKIGLTFANGLRAILRQDPDIIMVGEIRDLETLDMAIHAALTGHLVLSTLHCNDAAAAAARMVDMGAEPFLVASSVAGIVAQRLVRRICEHCKEEAPVSPEARAQLGLPDAGVTFYHGRGCPRCRDTGYLGRVSAFEVVPLVEPIQQAIMRKATAGEIRQLIREHGFPTLRDDGLAKARAGVTTLEEVLRAVYVDAL